MVALKLHLPTSGSVCFQLKITVFLPADLQEHWRAAAEVGGRTGEEAVREEFLLFEFLLRWNISGSQARDWLSGIDDGQFLLCLIEIIG